MTVLTTERLTLRPYEDRDAAAFRAMSLDPEVNRYLGGAPTEAEFDASLQRIKSGWAERGYSWWSVELRSSLETIGAVGLQHIDRDRSQPHEIGWRFSSAHWGHGYATEAARAAQAHCFDTVRASNLTAMALPPNAASINVMRKLGMRYVVTETHFGLQHVVYRIDRDAYYAGRAAAAAA